MFKIEATEKFKNSYENIPQELQEAAKKKLNLFNQNPRHPSLNTEKLEPKHLGIWSFRVNKQYRIIFQFKSIQTIILWNITKHYH